MRCNIVSCLAVLPRTPYSFFNKCTKNISENVSHSILLSETSKRLSTDCLEKSSGGWCKSWVSRNGKFGLFKQFMLMLRQASVWTTPAVKSLSSRWEFTRVQFWVLCCLWLWWRHYPETVEPMGTTICRWFGYNGWILRWTTKSLCSLEI